MPFQGSEDNHFPRTGLPAISRERRGRWQNRSVKQGEAKSLIKNAMRQARKTKRSSSAALQDIGESSAIEAFDALERQGDGSFIGADDDLKAFLWELANELDGTGGHSYGEYPGLLPRVIKAFTTAAGSRDPRGFDLRVGLLDRRIAAEHGFKPDTGWPTYDESSLQEELTSLGRLDLTPALRIRVEKSATLLAERRTGVHSTISFELPHPLVRRETSLAFEYEASQVQVAIRPTSAATNDVAFSEDVHYSLTVLGGGAWPPGVSQVTIAFRGLVDWTASVETYEDSAVSSTRGRSPAIPQLAADVVRSSLLALRLHAEDELDGYWMPVANDIRAYEFQVGTAAEPSAYHWHHLQPGGARATILDGPFFEADLGTAERPRPWQAARVYAHGALRSARYFDAAVWANVAIEAYIDEVLGEIAMTPGVNASELEKSISVFAEAEAIVARTYPDLAGTIDWPSTEKAPSRFRQIAAAVRLTTMGASKKELQRLYSAVSSQRNDAVHGRSIDSVPAREARAALAALDEFVAEFRVG